jgi:hypothetical protein
MKTEVGDAGLEHLRGLTNLQLLSVTSTHVTESGAADLMRTLPGLKVHR